MEIVLHTVHDHRERSVHHVQMRINAQRGGEEDAAVHRVAVEEIAVVEIAICAGGGNRLGQLMDGIVVGLGKHGASLTGPAGAGNAEKRGFPPRKSSVAVSAASAYFPRLPGAA